MGTIRHTLGRGRRRGRVPVHYSWRGEHNVRPRRRGIRITIGVRGRRIIPGISTRRRRVRCSSKRILGNVRRVRGLFSTGGRSFGLIAAHGV